MEIALERSGAATELVVRASGPGTAARISDVRVVPRTIRLDAMSGPFPAPHGTERRMSSSSSQVTAFIHELMLRGTHAVVATAQRDIEIEVPGPLSASVRAAYLNCAGDLYRPGE